MTGAPPVASLAVIGSSAGPDGPIVVHGVIGWAGSTRVVVPCDPTSISPSAVARLCATGPVQLRLPLDGLPAATSSGLTWATWVLPSIPTDVRDRPLGDAAAAVATSLLAVAA